MRSCKDIAKDSELQSVRFGERLATEPSGLRASGVSYVPMVLCRSRLKGGSLSVAIREPATRYPFCLLRPERVRKDVTRSVAYVASVIRRQMRTGHVVQRVPGQTADPVAGTSSCSSRGTPFPALMWQDEAVGAAHFFAASPNRSNVQPVGCAPDRVCSHVAIEKRWVRLGVERPPSNCRIGRGRAAGYGEYTTIRKGNRDVVLSKRRSRYQRYLQSSHWKTLREKALRSARFKCEQCGSATKLHVHHHRYRNLTDCTLEDVAALCERCHMDLHHPQRLTKRKKRRPREPKRETYLRGYRGRMEIQASVYEMEEHVNEMFRHIRHT